jgi:hypothetical protein
MCLSVRDMMDSLLLLLEKARAGTIVIAARVCVIRFRGRQLHGNFYCY